MSERKKFSAGDIVEVRFGVWGMVIADEVALFTDLRGKEIEFLKGKIPPKAVKIRGDRVGKDVFLAFKAVAVALDLPAPSRF